jgi:hypothetical protein
MPKAQIQAMKTAILTTLISIMLSINAAFSAPLLPSQDEANVFTVKICQDREVLSIIASSVEAILKTKVVIANGMQADDIHLDAVFVDQHAVYCSMTIAAKNVVEAVRFIIGPKDDSYLIVFGGNKGSRLFPKEVTMKPAR